MVIALLISSIDWI